jgi:RNA polymerase sigma factor (sigma-70 family)
VDDAEHSFERWYRLAYPRLSTSILALTGNRDLAAEVTDEAFARAWRHWRRVSEMDAPEGWTYRVALNLVRSRSRRRRIEQRILPRLVPRPESPASSGAVWELVRDLPERQRQAVVLRYVGDLDEREIAAVMGVTRGTVASTLFDAHQRLASAIDAPQAVEERS